MRWRPGIILTLALLFAVLAGLTQWVSYRLSQDSLEQVVHEREIDKVRAVGRGVEALIRQQVHNVQLVAQLLARQAGLAQAVAGKRSDAATQTAVQLDRIYRLAQVDMITLIDTDGRVVYRAHEPGRKGDRATMWGVAESLNGESSLTSESQAGGVFVHAIEPLYLGARIIGAVSVSLRLDQRLIKTLSESVGADLALVPRKGPAIASDTRLLTAIDPQAMADAFEQKVAVYRDDDTRRRTRVYLPILVVDDAYVVVADIDSAPAYRVLDQAMRRAATYAAAILVASVVAAVLLLGVVMRPLRALRRRAEHTALSLTGSHIQAQAGGEVAAVVEVLDTLTDRLVRSKSTLDQALACMEDGFLLCDAQDQVVTWNRRYLDIFPHLRTMLCVGQPFRQLAVTGAPAVLPTGTPEERAQWVELRMRSHASGESATELALPGGATIQAIERHTTDGGVVGVYHDITALRANERAMAEARAAADAANLAKSQFLSSMSHEIRTPLNGVLGMSELLQLTRLDAEQSRYADAIASAGRTLHSLLGDILDLAKIEEGKVEVEHIDFSPLQTLTDIAQVYRELASARGSLLVTDFDVALADLYGAGDPTRLRQVVTNLLGNALKFTDRGTITLGCRRGDTKDGDGRVWLVVSVRDTGVGIAPPAQAQLFQRFAQADASMTRRFGGSGLGLVICKHLVELMGGSIHVDSTPGQGSHFWFDLPLAPATAAPATDATALVALSGGARVLVAEDNPINQQVVQSLLCHLGAHVRVVDNGVAALQAVQHEQFDLALMDCQMPQMDGFEATRQIRAWERRQAGGARLRIVALTANALAGDREACLAAGMDDYLAKPVTGAKLAAVLGRQLAHNPRTPPMRDPPPAGDRPPADAGPSPAVFDASVLAALPMVADGSNPGFARKMLGLFATTTVASLAAIEAAVAAGQHDADQLRRVHSLKSASAQIGALALSELARQCELVLHQRGHLAPDVPQQLKQAFTQLQEALRAHDAQQPESPQQESP